jgi:hypothetical protein
MGEVRSRLTEAMAKSGRFAEVVSPPGALLGDSLSSMLRDALETSDYLIVGEVNAFHTKNIGRNTLSTYTLPLDVTILGLPNLVVVFMTRQKALLLTGGLFPAYTGECTLSLSLTVYSVEAGKALTTFSVVERARSPIDFLEIYGDLNNEDDDWIDLGRRLGEVALTNACSRAMEQIAQAVEKDSKKQ